MKKFLLFFFSILSLPMSMQAYVVSYSLWQFDDGTQVLLLGDCHAPGGPSKQHADIIQQKLDEWDNGSEKVHFILEEFSNAENKIEEDTDKTIDMLRNYAHAMHNNCLMLYLNKADYREDKDLFRLFYEFMISPNREEDISKNPEFYGQIKNIPVRNIIEVSVRKNYEKIFPLLQDQSELAEKCKKGIDEAFNNLIRETKINNKEIIINDLIEDTISYKMYRAHLSIETLIADTGFILELEQKRKMGYKRHLFFGGSAHAAAIFEFLKNNTQATLICKDGPCEIKEIFNGSDFYSLEIKKEAYIPIDSEKLNNVLNKAFNDSSKEQICINCHRPDAEKCLCGAGPFCQQSCMQKAWHNHTFWCPLGWRSWLLSKKMFGTFVGAVFMSYILLHLLQRN